MSLAFLILAHKNPVQVARLFHAIYHPGDTFVLHFDRRADDSLHDLGRQTTRRHANVHLLPAREIFWGGPDMAEVQIEAMRVALHAGSGWTHFINLTGQDFPLKSREEIIARLDAAPGRSHLSWFDPLQSPALWRNARERMTRYHLAWPWLHHLLALPGFGRRMRSVFGWQNQLPHLPGYQRRWPNFFHYYGGANHVILARAAVRHLVESPAARRIRRWLHAAGHSDEILFQSVLLNSRLASTLVNETLREIDFPPHSPHPRVFTSADLPRLLASPALFARKFDLETDAGIVSALEEKIRSVAACHS